MKPPQKIKVTPHGEVNKTFIISAISIGLVLILGILLFLSSGQFVGKAIAIPAGVVDLTLSDNVLTLTAEFTNPNQEVNGIYISLTSVPDEDSATEDFILCENINDVTVSDLWDFPMTACIGNTFVFGDGSLNFETYGTTSLSVDFIVNRELPESFSIEVNPIDIHDADTGLDLFDLQDGIFHFNRAPEPEVAATPSRSGGGGGGGGSTSATGTSYECVRSWDCTPWSTCSNSLQSRSCRDIKNCALNTSKVVNYRVYPVISAGPTQPEQSRTCPVDVTKLGRPSTRTINQQVPPPQFGSQLQQPAGENISLFSQYKPYFIAGPLVLIIIIILVVVILRHKKGPEYNYSQLKTWVDKERKMGTSNKDIRSILKQKTKWKDDEISLVMSKGYKSGTVCLVDKHKK
jgi:hypothetical protein